MAVDRCHTLAILATAACVLRLSHAQSVESGVASQLYTSLRQIPCVRNMAASFDIGCSSGSGGSSGFLFLIASPADLQAYAALPSWPGGRAAVITPAMMTSSTLSTLASRSYTAGAIFLPDLLSSGAGFSPASPALPDGAPSAWAWNPTGRSILRTRLPFPVISMSGGDAARLLDDVRNNRNAGYDAFPQAAVSFKFYMGPSSLTSYSCLDAASCLPVGGQSAWATLGPLDPQRPLVMLTSALDATGMFHDATWGADATVSGLVALLAAADALSRTPSTATLPLQVAFAAFQGEYWGSSGSRRWMADVTDFTCSVNVSASASTNGRAFCASPLRPDITFTQLKSSSIAYMLALDHVGSPGAANAFIHEVDNSTTGRGWISAIADALRTGGYTPATLTPQRAGRTSALPPSPLWTFLYGSPSSPPLRLDAASMSAYDTAFTSPFYASQFDNASNVDATVVTAAATLAARIVYAIATGNPDANAAAAAAGAAGITVNATLVAALLRCFTVNARCDTFAAYLGVPSASIASLFPAGPVALYPSVYLQSYLINGGNGYVIQAKAVEAFVRNFLAVASATQFNGTCSSTSQCGGGASTPYECLLGRCVLANAFYHDALSPAVRPGSTFNTFTYDKTRVDAIDVLWTEPYWSNNIGARSFRKDSYSVEVAVVVIGVGVVLASIAGTWALVRFLDARYKVP